MRKEDFYNLFDSHGINRGSTARSWDILIKSKGCENNITEVDVLDRLNYVKNVLIPCDKYNIKLNLVHSLSKRAGVSLENSIKVIYYCKQRKVRYDWFTRLYVHGNNCDENTKVALMINYIDLIDKRYGYLPELVARIIGDTDPGWLYYIENECFKSIKGRWPDIDYVAYSIKKVLKRYDINANIEDIKQLIKILRRKDS